MVATGRNNPEDVSHQSRMFSTCFSFPTASLRTRRAWRPLKFVKAWIRTIWPIIELNQSADVWRHDSFIVRYPKEIFKGIALIRKYGEQWQAMDFTWILSGWNHGYGSCAECAAITWNFDLDSYGQGAMIDMRWFYGIGSSCCVCTLCVSAIDRFSDITHILGRNPACDVCLVDSSL